MDYLALKINGKEIPAPAGIPTGGIEKLRVILGNGMTIVFTVALIAALFVFILGGIGWITSGGDKQKVDQARSRITYGVLGLLLILLSFGIVKTFQYFFGV